MWFGLAIRNYKLSFFSSIILFWYDYSGDYRDSVVVIGQGLHHILLE